MSRQRRRFSDEFKQQVVQEVQAGESQAAVARRHSVSANTVLEWLKAYRSGSLGGEGTGPSVQELLHDQKIKGEIIQQQTQEIHLLKKALAVSTSKSANSSLLTNVKSSRSKKPAP